MAENASNKSDAPHIPVLLRPLLSGVSPVSGTWLDGTFGAGGYTKGLRFIYNLFKPDFSQNIVEFFPVRKNRCTFTQVAVGHFIF